MRSLYEDTIASLEFSLKGRDDFFLTTSFGYQSSLLFFLLSEAGIVPKCLFIKSGLSIGGIQEQMDYITDRFAVDLYVVDRTPWVDEQLKGRDFMDLDESERRLLCRSVKRAPLLEFIELNAMQIWISGIRKDQTQARETTNFLSVTDLSVIKLSPLFNWSRSDVKRLMHENSLRPNEDYFDLCKLNESKECGLHF